jgi:hypothetical protein
MDYTLAISPDLKIGAEEFASVWNKDTTSHDIAQANSVDASTEKYICLDPELMSQGMVFLAGIASTIALDVVKGLIKDRIMKILSGRASSNTTTTPSFEVIVVSSGDNPLVVVKAKAEQS